MPRASDLTQLDFTPNQAQHLGAISNGVGGNFDALSALGNNSQADAYQIIANYNIFTTATSTTNSVKLPLALNDKHGFYIVRNRSSQILNLFPAVGDSINNLSANASTSIETDGFALIVKQSDTEWNVSKANNPGRTSFTPSDLTPTAGTVTGGTKTGWYIKNGDLLYFQASYVGFTQNTSTSTQYTASLPITGVGNIASVPISAYDANTGLMLTRSQINSTTTYILDRSGDWTAGQGVNLYVSGSYFVS